MSNLKRWNRNYMDVKSGVPQGSLLGHLVFI